MSGYSFFDYTVLIIAGLIVGYICIRLATFGMMRSYFEAKIWFIKKLKEGMKNGSTK